MRLKISYNAFSPGIDVDTTPAARIASEYTAPDAPTSKVRSRSKNAADFTSANGNGACHQLAPENGKGPAWGMRGLSTWIPAVGGTACWDHVAGGWGNHLTIYT